MTHHSAIPNLASVLGAPRFSSFFQDIAERLETYSRYIGAGREIGRLLNKTDAELANLGLRREEVAAKTFADHGLRIGQ
mgnify:CR=1 FL=1